MLSRVAGLAALLTTLAFTSGVLGGCSSADAASEETDPLKIDLGTKAAGTELSFDVPAGTTGFSIVVDAEVTANDFLGVQELRDPDGTSVVADFKPASGDGRSLTGQSGTGIGVVRIPLVEARLSTAVKPGRWTVRLGGMTSDGKASKTEKGTEKAWEGQPHGRVMLQKGDGGGTLDLDVYVPNDLRVGSDKVNAASAGANPYVRERIDLAYGMINRLWGLDRGEVRFHPIKGSMARLTSQRAIDAANEAADFPSERPAGQIILVNLLSPDGEDVGEISGVSNCLPGAVGVPGTKCSAVIVSLRENDEAWLDASVLVHELGHFVGLEHTTEFGGVADTLEDTPACEETEEKDGLRRCPDRDNIMFPSANLATNEASIWASESQRTIVRTSPIFQGR